MRRTPIRRFWAVSLRFLALGVLLLTGCRKSSPPAQDVVAAIRVLDSAPHDPEAFTQGLLIDDSVWLESTGRYGRSDLREVDRITGNVRRRVPLEPRLFGEGLALHKGRLYQLTWREGICLVYDRETFQEVERFRYEGEGWGLASDGRNLYMSDGSSRIRVLDPDTFAELRSFRVAGARGAVTGLNELEFVRGELWANVFQTRWIVRIDPRDGGVLGFLDLGVLPPPEDRSPAQDVLNGIAWDARRDEIWVTGKLWRRLYRIEPQASP